MHNPDKGKFTLPANILFFPAASLYAALIVPFSLAVMLHFPEFNPRLISGMGHAQALLFGFVPAVIAGYLLGPVSRIYLGILFLIWLTSIISRVLWPDSVLAILSGSLFVVMLAFKLPRRFKAAKKWRNRLLAPLLLSIFLLASCIMMRTSVLQSNPRANLANIWHIPLAGILIFIAAVLRIAVTTDFTSYLPMLWSAAGAWALAWLVVTHCLTIATGKTLERRFKGRIV